MPETPRQPTSASGSRAALLAQNVQIWLLVAVLGVLGAGFLWLGSKAQAQTVAEANLKAAEVARIEAERVRTEADTRLRDVARASEERDKTIERKAEERAAEQNVIHRKVDLLITLQDGRLPRDMPPASDFTPARATRKDGGP